MQVHPFFLGQSWKKAASGGENSETGSNGSEKTTDTKNSSSGGAQVKRTGNQGSVANWVSGRKESTTLKDYSAGQTKLEPERRQPVVLASGQKSALSVLKWPGMLKTKKVEEREQIQRWPAASASPWPKINLKRPDPLLELPASSSATWSQVWHRRSRDGTPLPWFSMGKGKKTAESIWSRYAKHAFPLVGRSRRP